MNFGLRIRTILRSVFWKRAKIHSYYWQLTCWKVILGLDLRFKQCLSLTLENSFDMKRHLSFYVILILFL